MPRSFTARLATGMLLLNAVVVGVAVTNIHRSWVQYNQRASVSAENVSFLLLRDVNAVFDRVATALKNADNEIEKQMAAGTLGKARLNAFLMQQQSFLPETFSLRATDQNGLVRYGAGVQPGTVVDVSDRPYFILQRDNAETGLTKTGLTKTGLIIAKPVLARIGSEWVIPVSRRLSRPDGAFAGVVYVNIPVAFFVANFSALKLGANGLVAMRDTDQFLMARYPEAPTGGAAFSQAAVSDQLRNLLLRNQHEATYFARNPSDGIERVFSFRESMAYPIRIAVGLAPQDYLDDWRRDAASMAGALILFNLVTFLFTRTISTAWRRQLASDEALSASEEQFRLLFKHSPVGISLVNQSHRFLDANDAFCRLLGYTVEELRDKTFLDITHPDSRETDLAAATDILTGAIPQLSIEKRCIHKDGHVVWVHVVSVVIRDRRGEMLYRLGIAEDITERREAEQIRTEQLEQQRDVLVREVHHRIKNNLQGVISLIEQLMLKQPAAADVLEEAAGQIGAIAVVHGLQGQTLGAEVRPRQLVRDIVDSISRLSVRVIECEEFDECKDCKECDEFSNRGWCLNERDTVSIALVVNELIYNAIKHTPAGPAASVAVRFGKQPGSFNIRVINRPATLPANFDWAKAVGLGTGLTLVASLLPGQGAKLTIEQHGDAVEAHLQLSHPCVSVPHPVS